MTTDEHLQIPRPLLGTRDAVSPLDLEEEVRKNVIVTSVDGILNWARASSLWPATFGLAPSNASPSVATAK